MKTLWQRILITLCLALLIPLILACMAGILQFIEFDLEQIRRISTQVEALAGAARAAAAAACLAALFVVVAGLIAVWRGTSRYVRGYSIDGDKAQQTRIHRSSVNALAKRGLLDLDGVKKARVGSVSARHGIRLFCAIDLDKDANVPHIAQLIQDKARQCIAEHLGIEVVSIQTSIRLV